MRCIRFLFQRVFEAWGLVCCTGIVYCDEAVEAQVSCTVAVRIAYCICFCWFVPMAFPFQTVWSWSVVSWSCVSESTKEASGTY